MAKAVFPLKNGNKDRWVEPHPPWLWSLFRDALLAVFPPGPRRLPRCRTVLILDRDIYRRFFSPSTVVGFLTSNLASDDTCVEYTTIAALTSSGERGIVERMRGVDVLVSPHGYHLLHSLYLPPHAVVIEVFNHRHRLRTFEALLCSLNGPSSYHSVHSLPMGFLFSFLLPPFILPTSLCMQWGWCRAYARAMDVDPPLLPLLSLIRTALHHVNNHSMNA
jgi:hypothetical protein